MLCIKGCCSSIYISGADYVGGIAGESEEIISNCYYDGRIEGRSLVGGLAGNNEGAIIASKSNASITVSGDKVGGITGKSNGGDVVACYADGFIVCESSSAQYIGGIIGYMGSCDHCYSTVNSVHSILLYCMTSVDFFMPSFS